MEGEEGSLDKVPISVTKTQSSAESVKAARSVTKPTVSSSLKVSGSITGTTRKKIEPKGASNMVKSTTRKPTVDHGNTTSNSAPAIRRNSTGSLPEKQQQLPVKKQISSGGGSAVGRKISSLTTTEPLRRSLPEAHKSSQPSSPIVRASRTMGSKSEASKGQSSLTSNVKSSPSLSSSSSSRIPSTSIDSTASSTTRKSISKLSSSAVSSGSKSGSLSSSRERMSTSSSQRKAATPEIRISRLIMLPQVETKANDDVRLDLRGHRIRSLKAGMNMSPNLEFVYLRDNLLSSLEGIEILKRVKVLDLSFNDFKGPGFEPLEACKALQQLYLAGNQITSLTSLPALPNLEFLSVAQNKLKSLSMASQPRLQVLAASKNRVSTLKGFPCLPSLEHLRLEENPVLEMPHVEAASILLVGPTLKKFNDRDLSHKEITFAKNYPPQTAVCIAKGWEFCPRDQALESTFHFLVEQWKDHFPPGYMLMEASVDQPFEEDACFCHFLFTKDKINNDESELVLHYQWFIGSTPLSNFTPIPNATAEVYWPKRDNVAKILKVECTPVLGDTKYPPIFAISSPVSPGTRCPKVLKLDVRGELVEGNIITGHPEVAWCGGTPAKGISSWLRRRWNSSPVVISGAENEEYLLTLDDIGSCLVYMYTPVTEEGTKGEPQYAITDYIKPAAPSVNNVQIIGDIVEGNAISGTGVYFGGKEGPSKFEWLRENKDTGDFVLVLTGTTEYNLSKEDVGSRLAFVYHPVNFEGQEGKSTSALSPIVKRAPPKVTNLKIIGDLREGSKITVTGNVTGATETSSRVQWFKTFSSILDGENGLEAVSTSKLAKAFRIPLGAVGCYIVAKFTPVNTDGESGEPAYIISDRSVENLPPNLNFLSITGDYSEGGILTASYGYIGGHEGKSIYNWYLHEVETEPGVVIPEASGRLQYNVTKDAIGKFISFTCTPLRDDGIIGESRTCMGQERVQPGSPRLMSLQVVGTPVEGTTLSVNKQYWGGEEGESVFRWFRTSLDGMQSEVADAATSSYLLSLDDIGFSISVSCEPVRKDLARGPIVLSEQIGPISSGPPTCKSLEFRGSMVEGGQLTFIASYSGGEKGACFFEWFRVKDNGSKEKLHSEADHLDLTLEEVGTCVELVYTPVRADGVKGSPKSTISSPISPGDPTGVKLVIPDCCEAQVVVPLKTYFGGQEGEGNYIWYRTRSKLDALTLMDISENAGDDVATCGKTTIYTPSLEDVGAYLALYWVPTRSDGKSGEPLVSICNNPVGPAFPEVSKVGVKALSLSSYSGEGEYFGGYEGESIFSWYRKTIEGTIVLIDGAHSKTYQVSDSDYTCRLLFGYTPVRSDSVVGELKLSEPTDVILPEIPRIEMLALTGKAVEREVLTATEVIPKSDAQQNVWQKYKKHVRYQWYICSEENKSFEPLQSQCSCSYKLRFDDIGSRFKCECIVTDTFGRSSEPAYSETAPVSPGIPKIEKLEIEGRGFHTNLYAVRGNYSGGKEGKSKIQWLRSMVGSPDLISIPGETGRMYEANVDDVGYRLVAIYTPVREDGTEGCPVSASTEPITVEPDVLKEVKQKLDLGSVKFEALCDKDRSSKKVSGVSSLERRILEVNRKRVKVVKPGSKTSFPTTEIRGSYTPPFHVETFGNDQHRLKIVVDSENEVELMVQTRHMRDVIVLVIRGFAQRFNSTSLNSLLKLDA
ncbi:187-kDa microtubule-associated protein AIR9 isoform X1 [Lactuca sativa]|uniref:187-kDa microtubule-associated protein AIR9 isoform X1 n=1 Tax=Lactuca sativa TaxID=4236 RepID=UPI000CD9AB10|nr:187-kDa microtubule-associated protein AIR9 isoform X1 [Lactuca sativa]XP_023758152.1 187-kDa microtubule-associated protein AIR9 isoform X1 [Lactuca sativa]XP_023758153.1 187-kDa microtubule-associated protein AIR9 isoform X1 [Lactuca sativa]